MNRLRDRHLELGRGRVYRNVEARLWAADYRDLEGNVYGVWAGDITDAHRWIREKAEFDASR